MLIVTQSLLRELDMSRDRDGTERVRCEEEGGLGSEETAIDTAQAAS